MPFFVFFCSFRLLLRHRHHTVQSLPIYQSVPFPVFASRFCLDLASAIGTGIAFILYVVVLYVKYRALLFY